jgi:hypothetical protein
MTKNYVVLQPFCLRCCYGAHEACEGSHCACPTCERPKVEAEPRPCSNCPGNPTHFDRRRQCPWEI